MMFVTGLVRQYIQRMTSAPIRDTFRQAKVGGPAVANANGDLLPEFVELCAKEGIRLTIRLGLFPAARLARGASFKSICLRRSA